MLRHLTILFIFCTYAAWASKLTIINPRHDTVWRAGEQANVTWTSALTRVTIELYPATDANRTRQRVVALLADKTVVNGATSISFRLPKEIPAWRYVVRMWDSDVSKRDMSYSSPFTIADHEGNVVDNVDDEEVEEPKFPRAAAPKACIVGEGECDGQKENVGEDPRAQQRAESSAIGQHEWTPVMLSMVLTMVAGGMAAWFE